LHFGFVYVALSSPALAERRVAARVAEGGHDVPPDKLRARFQRSLNAMPWFLEQADVAYVYCNDGTPPVLVAQKGPPFGLRLHRADLLPNVLSRLCP